MKKILKSRLEQEIENCFSNAMKMLSIDKKYIDEQNDLDLPHIDRATKIALQTTGLDLGDIGKAIDDGVIEFQAPKNVFLYKKRPIFVYIRDMYLTSDDIYDQNWNRVHLCFCQALQNAKDEHRFTGRYVCSYRSDGIFTANIFDKHSREPLYMSKKIRLIPCKQCLSQINWHNSKNLWREFNRAKMSAKDSWKCSSIYRDIKEISDDFNVAEYIEWAKKEVKNSGKYKDDVRSLHKRHIKTSAQMAVKKYCLDSKEKYELKKEYKFVCQKCLNRFASNKLQIHHINHNEGDNSKRNLLVVCKNCHEKIHKKEGGVFIDS